jgi:hypothetical protein
VIVVIVASVASSVAAAAYDGGSKTEVEQKLREVGFSDRYLA